MSNNKRAVRYAAIDSLRGWLIMLVMLGHLVIGSVNDNLIRYSIYAFHMPLFIGLTGYLINADSLRGNSTFVTLRHYFWRVLLPFSFAFLFFTAVLLFHAFEENRITSNMLLSYIHTPYYHLWFVPTLVLWVFAYSAILKFRIPLNMMLFICLAASLTWAALPKADQWFFVELFLSKKLVYFFSFFLFGAWLRTAGSRKFKSIFTDFKVLPITVITACAGFYLLQIGDHKSLSRAIAWLIMNVALITLFINLASSDLREKGSIIADIGRNSLPIYLWHVLPLFILKGFDIHQSQVLIYYGVGGLSLGLIVFIVLGMEGKNKWLDRCLYGKT